MSTFVAMQMSNGRWFVVREGAALPAVTQDPSFEMGLTEERAHELARHASHRAGHEQTAAYCESLPAAE